jgi:signal transduction histidine kinase
MHRHVERELARARVAGGRSGKLTPLADVVDRIVNAMGRLARGDMIDWQLEIPQGFRVAIDPDDLSELLGNLLDNSREWARSKVRLSAGKESGVSFVSVEDDGPGVPPDKMKLILERGVRLDETRKGTGIGLAIVSDIAEAYGFGLETFNSELGGLGVRLRLAGAAPADPAARQPARQPETLAS